jgi:hypothetical protein
MFAEELRPKLVYVPFYAPWVGELLVSHDPLHLGGGELAAPKPQAELAGLPIGREGQGPHEAVHRQAPRVLPRPVPRGIPPDALPLLAGDDAAPDEELAVGAGAVVLGLVLAAVGAAGGPHAASVPVGAVLEPACVGHALHAHVRVEQVVAAGEGPPAFGRRRREVPERDIAAGPAVRLARRQAAAALRLRARR